MYPSRVVVKKKKLFSLFFLNCGGRVRNWLESRDGGSGERVESGAGWS